MGVGLDTGLVSVIGARSAKLLADKLELRSVGELLRHYPRKYDRRGRLTDLSQLVVGEKVTVWARVKSVNNRELSKYGGRGGGRTGGVRRVTTIVISDGSRELTCTFFNQYHWSKTLPPGSEAMFSGKVSRFNSTLQIASPQVVRLDGEDDPDSQIETIESFPGGVIPVYPLTEGLTQPVLQKCVKTVLAVLDEVPDPVPVELLAAHGLTELGTALADIHRPRTETDLDRAKERLRYDEALAIQLVLARRRAAARQHPAAPCPPVAGGLLDAFDATVPFSLTDGQIEVGEQITEDLTSPHPMNRLLQGEVGSGKTVVALRGMLQVIDSGRQTVLLAPTEVLAAQHARSLRQILGPLGQGGELGAPAEATRITLLTGSLPTAARRAALLDIASGETGIAVGTHALLSDTVMFAELGLVVVDEQHRFGVEQRDVLRSRQGRPPHVLVMTATPIPRTVAMTVFGDLDTSTLTELPRGRSPIGTTVVPVGERPGWLGRAWQRIVEEVGQGHQAFVVCPKIGDGLERAGDPPDDGGGFDADLDDPADDGPTDERRPPLSVIQVAEMLSAGPLAGLRLAVLHGRLPPVEKDEVMRAFATGDLDVLVATTVIEVGVDVPNATMMVIMDAERFGMSQLHQLRGRVGRGTAPGVCLLVTEAYPGTPGMTRLEAVASTNDGFRLAEADLELRREGDVLGTSQAGRATSLRQLSLLRDREVIEQARADALDLVGDDPALARFPGLAEMLPSVIAEESQDYLGKG